MNTLKTFSNEEFGNIRTIEENGKIYFCGKDIASALGYSNPRDALSRHCRGVVKRDGVSETTNQHGVSSEQINRMSFIPEGDVYRLITHSKLPTAENFESWVFDEVLPTIRKTGGYVNNEELFVETYLAGADAHTKAIFSETLKELRRCNEKIAADKPKVLFADAVETSKTSILVGDLAKIIKQNGVDIGQKRLFDWLRQNGYLIKGGSSKNMPTQTAMNKGLFEVKETTITNPDGSIRVTKTTKVTGKGQQYFINKFLKS